MSACTWLYKTVYTLFLPSSLSWSSFQRPQLDFDFFGNPLDAGVFFDPSLQLWYSLLRQLGASIRASEVFEIVQTTTRIPNLGCSCRHLHNDLTVAHGK